MSKGVGVRWLVLCVIVVALGIGPTPALAQSAQPTIAVWLPGPNSSGDPSYVGAVEQPLSGNALPAGSVVQIVGWVVDKSARGWSGIDGVQVYDGLMGAGGNRLADASIQLSRPDVAAALGDQDWAASGFSASVPSASLQSTAMLYVYAHTPAKGWWFTQEVLGLPAAQYPPGVQLDIQSPTPLATVHSNKPYLAFGYAVDRTAAFNQGAGIDRVQVYLNGDRQTGISIGDASLGRPNPNAIVFGAQFATAGWQLTFQPASWMSNITDNQITPLSVYAHSAVTGQETQTTIQIVISVP